MSDWLLALPLTDQWLSQNRWVSFLLVFECDWLRGSVMSVARQTVWRVHYLNPEGYIICTPSCQADSVKGTLLYPEGYIICTLSTVARQTERKVQYLYPQHASFRIVPFPVPHRDKIVPLMVHLRNMYLKEQNCTTTVPLFLTVYNGESERPVVY